MTTKPGVNFYLEKKFISRNQDYFYIHEGVVILLLHFIT